MEDGQENTIQKNKPRSKTSKLKKYHVVHVLYLLVFTVFSSICSIFHVLYIDILIVAQLQIEFYFFYRRCVLPVAKSELKNPNFNSIRIFYYLHFGHSSDVNIVSWALKGQPLNAWVYDHGNMLYLSHSIQ